MTRGRPAGSSSTPHRVLRKSLQDSARLAVRARKLLEGQLAAIERRINDTTTPWDIDGDVIDQILKILAALDRTVEQTGKLLTQKHTPTDLAEAASLPDVLHELTKGKKL
jgi:hypothetical protein